MVYKCLHDLTPPYLADTIKPRGDSYMEQTGMLVGNFEFNP
mgnify:CR=1 FL=1